MLKHAAILVVAVVTSIGAAKGLLMVAGEPTAPQAQAATLSPTGFSSEAAATGAAAVVAKGDDGHYWADARIDGRMVHFLVDTGASVVALTPADARRVGLDLASLDYDHPVNTANGQTRAAQITIDALMIGDTRMENVEALVVPEGLQSSLLGMSYLGRLSRFEATRENLVLRP